MIKSVNRSKVSRYVKVRGKPVGTYVTNGIKISKGHNSYNKF